MAHVVSIELLDSIFIRNDAKGAAINLDLTKVPAGVLASLVTSGATVILNNTYNGGGKDRAEVDKEAALLKRIDAWYKGSFTMIERGESQYTAMRDQYAAEQEAKFGRSRAETDKLISATVKDTLGKDTAASFANFLEAVATQKQRALVVGLGKSPSKEALAAVPTVLALREDIEKALAERTAEAAAKRAEVAKGLDLSTVDLGL